MTQLKSIRTDDPHPGSVGKLAHAELDALTVDLFPYALSSGRVWELRDNLTPYDAWYVALAEQLGADLVTLDRRLVAASGPRCGFRVPLPTDNLETGME